MKFLFRLFTLFLPTLPTSCVNSVPEGWKAVSNTAVDYTQGSTVHFRETEPFSTYLFSFVAGKFECVTAEGIDANGTPIHQPSFERPAEG